MLFCGDHYIMVVDYHHFSRFAEHEAAQLIGCSFGRLFLVWLLPFKTAWVADIALAGYRFLLL